MYRCAFRCLPPPRRPPRKVTVLGAGTAVGRVAALMLKQQPVIRVLALYDEEPARGVLAVAADLANVDTSTRLEAYQGRVYLKDALHDADVALICGGRQLCHCDRDLFFENMQYVHSLTLAVAKFAPHAVLAVQTPPVDCNFSLCMHTLKMARAYDRRRLLGVNSVNAMRANQLISSLTGAEAGGATAAVVCGAGRFTRVPALGPRAASLPQAQLECITRLVREADDIICKVKGDGTEGYLSVGFATARCVVSIMQGLFESPSLIDSAMVEQESPSQCYDMAVCSSPVRAGRGGVQAAAAPTLSGVERQLLEESRPILEDMLELGRCNARGDHYRLPACRSPA